MKHLFYIQLKQPCVKHFMVAVEADDQREAEAIALKGDLDPIDGALVIDDNGNPEIEDVEDNGELAAKKVDHSHEA
jgi:hypothetical protein